MQHKFTALLDTVSTISKLTLIRLGFFEGSFFWRERWIHCLKSYVLIVFENYSVEAAQILTIKNKGESFGTPRCFSKNREIWEEFEKIFEYVEVRTTKLFKNLKATCLLKRINKALIGINSLKNFFNLSLCIISLYVMFACLLHSFILKTIMIFDKTDINLIFLDIIMM